MKDKLAEVAAAATPAEVDAVALNESAVTAADPGISLAAALTIED